MVLAQTGHVCNLWSIENDWINAGIKVLFVIKMWQSKFLGLNTWMKICRGNLLKKSLWWGLSFYSVTYANTTITHHHHFLFFLFFFPPILDLWFIYSYQEGILKRCSFVTKMSTLINLLVIIWSFYLLGH